MFRNQTEVAAAQYCECTKCHCIVHFMVNFMLCEFYFNTFLNVFKESKISLYDLKLHLRDRGGSYFLVKAKAFTVCESPPSKIWDREEQLLVVIDIDGRNSASLGEKKPHMSQIKSQFLERMVLQKPKSELGKK